ncbi:ras and Rab interactor 3-like [Scomber scombrus]
MGIEFWSSHLNIRGPRETPKPRKDKGDKKPDTVTSAPPPANPQKSSVAQPDSAPQSDSDNRLKAAPESDNTNKQSAANQTLFHEFCPITTRSPRELDYGSGMGALCFINPLFLQSQTALSRRRMFKRSLKVRVSTETSTLLSPPLAPPPPPPLMPKTKGKCKAKKCVQGTAQPSKGPGLLQGENPSQVHQNDPTSQDTQLHPLTQNQDTRIEAQVQHPSPTSHFQPVVQEQGQTQKEAAQGQVRVEGEEATALLVMENLPEDSNYMQPSPMINLAHSPSFSSYLSPSVSPMAPPLFPKLSPSFSPHDSPGGSPSISPYQSPSLSPKVPFSLSPYDSPSASPSLSPYQSPSPSPKVPFSLSPFTSPSFSQLAEATYHTPATPSRPDQQRSEGQAKEGAGEDENKDEEDETEALHKEREAEETDLVLQIDAASLNDNESCSSFSSLEEAAETPLHSPHQHDKDTIIT